MTEEQPTSAFGTVELSDPLLERDGLRLATVKSRALGRRVDVSFWAPPGASRIPTLLILLHGVYGSHWVWSLKGGAHLTADRLVRSGSIAPLAVAMPSDGLLYDGSAYLRWPATAGMPAMDIEQFLIEEIPQLAALAVPALQPRPKIAIAGLSMGGYGALRLGAKYPESFCAISAHSAITDLNDLAGFVEEPIAHYRHCAPSPETDVLYWLRQHRDRLPPLRFDCGTEDRLLPSNRGLHEALRQEGIPHTFAEFPGDHAWPYWRQHLEDTLLHVDRHSRGGADA